jgi:hypothetical protein
MPRTYCPWVEEDIERKTGEREHEEFQGIQPAVWEQNVPPRPNEKISYTPDRGPDPSGISKALSLM